MALRRVTVFGGSGFVGRHIVRRLAERGAVVRVGVRDPEAALFLKPMGGVGQIVPVYADIRDDRAVAAALDGADAVFNAVGLYRQGRRNRFADIHVDGAARIARLAAERGVKALVHMSGLGADARSNSPYIAARAAGDAAVRRHFAAATILRPSVVFGPDDKFFSLIGKMAKNLPALPLFGGGRGRVQPVFAGDVGEAAVRAALRPDAAGRVFELGGPRVYTYREIVALTLAECGFRRLLVPVPMPLAYALAALVSPLPNPPVTRDMLKLMAGDTVVAEGAAGLADLGIEATSVEAILPTYMDRFRKGGRWKNPRFA